MPYLDIKGQRFARLTALEYVGKSKWGRAMWRCRCDCGVEKIVDVSSLLRGLTKSCGCYQRDVVKGNGKAHETHGLSKTRIYSIWCGMISRCKSNKYYTNIFVCDEWLKFEPFYEWAISNGYRDDLTIDRIDNNGNYEPANCRWATRQQQMNNTSRNYKITYRGETKTIREWFDLLGVKCKDSFRYWKKKGLSDEEIIEHFMKKKGVNYGTSHSF